LRRPEEGYAKICFTVLQSRAYLGFSAQLKSPQSLILAAIRGVTPRCPSEVEGCHPDNIGVAGQEYPIYAARFGRGQEPYGI